MRTAIAFAIMEDWTFYFPVLQFSNRPLEVIVRVSLLDRISHS